jgi:hypothetical protein
MPYVFDRLSKLMGEGNANIFQQGQDQNQPQRRQGFKLTGEGGGEAAGGQQQVKDTGGSQPAMALTSGAAQQEIAAKNQPASSGGVLGGVSTALESQNQRLQQEADKYGQTAEQQQSSLVAPQLGATKERVSQALRSGQTDQLKSALAGQKQDIDAFETSVNPESIKVPKSRDELASYLQGQKGGQYTKGMSRLDAALLGKSQGFQQEQQALQAKKEALEAKRQQAMGLTDIERRQLQDQAGSESAMIRQALESLSGDVLKTGGKGKEAFKNRMLAGPSNEEKQAALIEAQKAAGLGDVPLSALGVDPSQFYRAQVNPDVDAENLLNYLGDPEYQQYAQIQELLGQAPAQRQSAGFSGSFDQQALQEALKSSGQKWRDADRAKAPERAKKMAENVEQRAETQRPHERDVPTSIAASKKQGEQVKEKLKEAPSNTFKKIKKSIARLPSQIVTGMR